MKEFFNFIEGFKRTDQSMDKPHCLLVYALAVSNKPWKLLEIGIGAGYVTEALYQAIKYNGIGDLITIDNFHDWKGCEPSFLPHIKQISMFTKSNEQEFVKTATKNYYDFIVLDADHNHSHEWAEQVYDLGEPSSTFIIHDINYAPNLRRYLDIAKERGYSHFIFDKSSRKDEGCEVGLLIVRKDK